MELETGDPLSLDLSSNSISRSSLHEIFSREESQQMCGLGLVLARAVLRLRVCNKYRPMSRKVSLFSFFSDCVYTEYERVCTR